LAVTSIVDRSWPSRRSSIAYRGSNFEFHAVCSAATSDLADMPPLWRRIVREAHRRSVWQVLGVYLVGSWFAYQVVLGLYDGLGLPDWLPAVAVVLFVIGLPIVLATAIVQEGPPVLRGGDPDASPRGPLPAADAPGGAPAPAVDEAAPSAPAPKALSFLTWRRALVTGALAFVVLGLGTTGFMTMRHLGIGPAGTLMARGVLEEGGTVVMADFAAAPGDTALATAVAEALRIDLIQSRVIRVAEAGPVASALRRMQVPAGAPLTAEVARRVAEREGYKAVIAGDVAAMGSGYMLTARLVSAADGATLAAFREPARDSATIIDAVDRLSRAMRERVGESLRSIRASPPLNQVSTHSLPALRLYSEAERLQREGGDNLRVVDLLEDAIRMDSTFAMGWRRLSTVLGNIGIRYADQVRATTRAWELRDRLPETERYLAIASYEGRVRGDAEAAVAAYRQILAVDPRHGVALTNLPASLMGLRQFEEADRILTRAIEVDDSYWVWHLLIAARVALARTDEVHDIHRRAMERFPDNLLGSRREAALAVVEGRWDLVDSLAADRIRRFPDNPFAHGTAYLDQVHAATAQGRLRDIAPLHAAIDQLSERAGLTDQLLRMAISRARVEVTLYGDISGALRRVEDALRRWPMDDIEPGDRPWVPLAWFFAAAGLHDRADAALAAAVDDAPPGVDRSERLDGTRGWLDLERGDGEAALAALRVSTRTGRCTICGLAELGAAYELVGQPDSARIAYQRFLDTPDLNRIYEEALHRPAVLVRLAELHEAVGEYEAARARYAEFLRLWENADPELMHRVEAVRRRLAGL
jgi:eukaryotic-like serine/threonine-protein kinase